MIIFDGYQFAAQRETLLKERVSALKTSGVQLSVAAVLFVEDKGSQLYTDLKRQAAERVGIEYRIFTFSVKDPVEKVAAQIEALNVDPKITGIIIQKPSKRTWEREMNVEQGTDRFQSWWTSLATQIAPAKDVDGLHPETLAAVKDGSWRQQGKVMPATAKAVLSILDSAGYLKPAKFIVVGKSDILGKPLAYELKNRGYEVELLGRKDLESRAASGQLLKDADVIISATGQSQLITGNLLRPGVALVDVGEPRPDVDRQSVEQIASFLTPVPGGVGPVTVVSLLENAVDLAQ